MTAPLTGAMLREALAKATPGPWEICTRYREALLIASAERDRQHGWASDPEVFAEEYMHPIASESPDAKPSDWELIVLLVNAAPQIAEALDRDQKRLWWLTGASGDSYCHRGYEIVGRVAKSQFGWTPVVGDEFRMSVPTEAEAKAAVEAAVRGKL